MAVRNTDTEERQDGAQSFDSFEGVDWDRSCALSAETTPKPKPPPCLNRKRPAASAHVSRYSGADVAFHHQFGRGERTKRHSFESAGLTATQEQENSDTDTDLEESEIIRDIALVTRNILLYFLLQMLTCRKEAATLLLQRS